jgi:hypothetical protein
MKNNKSPQIGDSKQHIFAVIFYNIMHSGGKKMQNLKIMKIIPLFLVIALAIGFVSVKLISGNRQNNTETEIWSNVTNFNQLEGTWKLLSNVTFPFSMIENMDESWKTEVEEHSITFNVIAKTATTSGKFTEIYTGGNIDTWETWKQEWKNSTPDDYTIVIDEMKHSISNVFNDLIQTLTEEDIITIMNSFQINQNETKLKEIANGIEVIYTI